jgi:hypothetical protein
MEKKKELANGNKRRRDKHSQIISLVTKLHCRRLAGNKGRTGSRDAKDI